MNAIRTGTVTSADGTVIGFDQSGAGPAVILVQGALMNRSDPVMTGIAAGLSRWFTVLNYDRRGRGGRRAGRGVRRVVRRQAGAAGRYRPADPGAQRRCQPGVDGSRRKGRRERHTRSRAPGAGGAAALRGARGHRPRAAGVPRDVLTTPGPTRTAGR